MKLALFHVLIIASFSLQMTQALKCYECGIGPQNTACDLEDKIGKKIDCNKNLKKPACYILEEKVGDKQVVQRGCDGYDPHASLPSATLARMTACDTDFCNENFETAGAKNSIPYLTMIITMFAVKFFL